MMLANYVAANASAPAGIRPGISAFAGRKFPDLLGPGAPVNARDFEVRGNALGRTGAIQTVVSAIYKALSCLYELSCNAVALQWVGDKEAAYNGLITLMAGPQLVPNASRDALFAQTEQGRIDKVTEEGRVAALASVHCEKVVGAEERGDGAVLSL